MSGTTAGLDGAPSVRGGDPGQILARFEADAAQRLFRIRVDIAKLEDERARVSLQAEWMRGWQFVPSRHQYRHADGHTLAREIIERDTTAWPFLALWYDLEHIKEASRVATTSAARHPKTETSAAHLPLSQHGDDNR